MRVLLPVSNNGVGCICFCSVPHCYITIWHHVTNSTLKIRTLLKEHMQTISLLIARVGPNKPTFVLPYG